MPYVMESFSRILSLIRLCALLLLATATAPSSADYIQRVVLVAPQVVTGHSTPELGSVSSPVMRQNIFDWNVLKRWNLTVSNLPPNTEVVNRPAWFCHQHLIINLAILMALAITLVFTVFQWRHTRLLKQNKDVLSDKQRELERSRSELRRLAKAVIKREENSNLFLARELHDDISQSVAALAISLNQLKKMAIDSGFVDTTFHQALSSLHSDHVRLADDLHSLAHRLHPAIIGELGLVVALPSFINDFARVHSMEIPFYCDLSEEDIPPEISLCLYRVVQQSLSNVHKHAKTDRVRVFLCREENSVKLVVEDEGVGFDPDAPNQGSGGIGLISMSERVLALGGTWEVFSEPDSGTTISAKIPVEF